MSEWQKIQAEREDFDRQVRELMTSCDGLMDRKEAEHRVWHSNFAESVTTREP